MQTVHASAVMIAGTGILIVGPSGSGKSALALDLIDQCMVRGIEAALIGDDRLIVTSDNGRIVASPAPALAGMIEVRGSGIHRISNIGQAELHLAVRLVPESEAVRMPDMDPVEVFPAVRLPLLKLPQGQAAVRAILAHLGHYGGVESAMK